MQKLFLSYSSKDREFVRALQQAVALSGEDVWVDFHELAGGDALWEGQSRRPSRARGWRVEKRDSGTAATAAKRIAPRIMLM